MLFPLKGNTNELTLSETEIEDPEAWWCQSFGTRQAGTSYLLLKFTNYVSLENLLNIIELFFFICRVGEIIPTL